MVLSVGLRDIPVAFFAHENVTLVAMLASSNRTKAKQKRLLHFFAVSAIKGHGIQWSWVILRIMLQNSLCKSKQLCVFVEFMSG